MNRVFADASYWIAMFNPKDSLNAAARAASQTIGKARIITTDEALIEFVNYYSKGDAHVRTALTDDRHFEQEGFKRLMGQRG